MKLRTLAKLGARGSAHLLLPLLAVVLVGVVGTYMLVGSHAGSIRPKTVFYIFSYDGTRQDVAITSDATFTNAQCGKIKISPTAALKVSLFHAKTSGTPEGGPSGTTTTPVTARTSYKPLQVTCYTPTGNHAYYFSFSQNNGASYDAPAVTATAYVSPISDGKQHRLANACAYVHYWGINRVAAQTSSGGCSSSDTDSAGTPAATAPAVAGAPAAPAKLTPVVSVKQYGLTKHGAGAIGVLDLPKGAYNKTACSGTMTETVVNSGGTGVATQAAPLTWDGSHCNYAISSAANFSIPAGKYTINVVFAGNDKLNAANHAPLHPATLK